MRLILGDCLEVMKNYPDAIADAIVTDPPAGISFMGKDWDHSRGGRDAWIVWLSERLCEARRLAKPGSYMLCWAIPRTSHWTGIAIEKAGWVIRDRVSHLFGTGFPKSKSCLKPACEDWWLAWNENKNINNLNIDGCRIPTSNLLRGGDTSRIAISGFKREIIRREGWDRPWMHDESSVKAYILRKLNNLETSDSLGRWPSNVVLSHHEDCNGGCHPDCPVRMLGEQGGDRPVSGSAKNGRPSSSENDGDRVVYKLGLGRQGTLHNDCGSAARFFYTAKASRKDRGKDNTHPTVKSTSLMRWLCRLITPTAGTVLDPFMGSGSTGVAALREGFDFIGIEQEAEYLEIARRRLGEPPDDNETEDGSLMSRVQSVQKTFDFG